MKIDKSLMSGSTTLLILSLLSGGEMYGAGPAVQPRL